MTKAEARKALEIVISEWAGFELAVFHGENVLAAIDAFERAAVAEALQPRDPAPGLAEAERWLKREAHDEDVLSLAPRAIVIADELDRLRGALAKAQSNYSTRLRRLCECLASTMARMSTPSR